ncbi:MAG: SGNH/GDSL hydrolase family protein [Butyrivibrio sp.]|nr:SGNH/GDSL hydrolase family protein [Butyrivibrio sp.]
MNRTSEVHAPRNPHEKGSRIYFMNQAEIEGRLCPDGSTADLIYLDMNRLREKIHIMNEIDDEEILSLFDSAQGFRKIVAGIGISFEDTQAEQIGVQLQFYGKKSRYESGTHLTWECPADGSETLLWLEDADWSGDDDVPGQFQFHFPKEGMQAKVTVVFYAAKGYVLPEQKLEPEVDYGSTAYRNMIAASFMSGGNNARLKKAAEKAQRGETVTVAFIGGSITQGAGAKPGNTACYSWLLCEKLRKLLHTDKISYVRAGVGGTPSELGMIRFERDVLRKGTPDLVIIEFAVNDSDDETQGRCYESLVRKALQLSADTAVILLFSVFSNDWNLQERLAPVGEYYQLPMVSIRNAVCPQFHTVQQSEKVISRRQYFYDTFHPSNDGHKVMADSLAHLIGKMLQEQTDLPAMIPQRTLLGRTFEEVALYDRRTDGRQVSLEAGSFTAADRDLQGAEYDDDPHLTSQFPNNWMHDADAENDDFILKVTCKSLFLVYKDSGNDMFGQAEVLLDGKTLFTADPKKVGWTHCHAQLLLESDERGEHEVRIRMASGYEHMRFTVLGFGICD